MSDTETIERDGDTDTEQDEAGAAGDAAEGVTVDPEATEDKVTRKVLYAGKDFDMVVLDELPDNEVSLGRNKVYFEVLSRISEDTDNLGKWHEVARFSSPMGAGTVASQLNKQVKGEVMPEDISAMPAKDRPEGYTGWIKEEQAKDIPEFEGWYWAFDSRKVAAASGKIGDRDSVLYAKLVEGAPPAAEAPAPTEG